MWGPEIVKSGLCRIIVLSLFCPILFCSGSENPACRRMAAGKIRVTRKILPEISNGSVKYWHVACALPVSNMYQKISISGKISGKVAQLRDKCGKSVMFSRSGKKVSDVHEYTLDISFYKLHTVWSKVKNVPPPSGKHSEFTGKVRPWIDPGNPEIQRISGTLSKKSKDTLDYVRQCYAYVTGNYQYLNPNTGIHSLSKILQNGGGDCGNLSSIFVSLLRCRKIPARHVIGVRPDNSPHVWSEFYLDNYGWFPADVTADLGKKSFRCFGNWDDRCIVMHYDLGFKLRFPDGNRCDAAMLQNYFFFYRGSGKLKIENFFVRDSR